MSRAASKRAQHVARASGGRDGKKHVARLPEPAHLALEHMLEAIIVADGGEHRGVGGERHGRQRPAVGDVTRQEFGGQMLRIGSAAAIAGNQELAAGAHRGFDCLRDRTDQRAQLAIRRRFLQRGERPVEKAGEQVIVVRPFSHVSSFRRGRANSPGRSYG